MEQFGNWEEAERYFLPEFQEEVDNSERVDVQPDTGADNEGETNQTTLGGADSSKDTGDLNEMSQILLNKLNFKKDADAGSVNSGGTRSFPASPISGSSRASPEYSTSQLEDSELTNKNASTAEDDARTRYAVPASPDTIKPLMNAVLWRLHAQPEPPAAGGCILVTNDRVNQSWAQKFGITVKTVPQLRTSIIYEEKEFKNHCKYLEKNQPSAEPKTMLSYEDESDEDVLVFVPRGQGNKSRAAEGTPGRGTRKQAGSRGSNGQANVGTKAKEAAAVEPGVEAPTTPIDPDSFSRNIATRKQQQKAIDTTAENGNNRGSPNGSISRAGGGRRGGGRGNAAFRGGGRGRGKLFVP